MLKALLTAALLAVVPAGTLWAQEVSNAERPAIDRLMREALASAKGLEVFMDVVSLPAGQTLPKHTHPGEEFIYVMEGSAILWRQGMDPVTLRAGDAAMIEPGVVHTAITQDEAVKALVMRVHVQGQPERTLAQPLTATP